MKNLSMQSFCRSTIILVVLLLSRWVNSQMAENSFYIQAYKLNGFVLDVERQNVCPDAYVVMNPMRPGRPSQVWEIYQGNMLRNVYSGHVLDVADHKPGGDGFIVMWPAVGRKEQQWVLTNDDHIRNAEGKCLDVFESRNYTGAKLITYNCERRANQLFRYVSVNYQSS